MNPLLNRFKPEKWKNKFISGPTEVRLKNFEYVIGESVEKMGVFGDISMLFERTLDGRYVHPMIKDLWHRYLAFCDGAEIAYTPGHTGPNRMAFRGFITQTLRMKASLKLESGFDDEYHELMFQVWLAAMKARYPDD
jgi:hypothetical protein